ncbi:acid protease [Wolfiporia cocos MD-104 SS10]|uniref:Acid protease n=1 Tax=Wolfiporia cocos (strain MD-104) TaxID=742152 RepID=A0A2H3J220_WOLCO|nr:acid protease [Wolfiporia cocos MD-104 SS10]
MNALFFALFVSLCGISHALTIPVSARARDPQVRREYGSGVRPHVMKMYGIQHQDVENFQDTVYATNLTIGGQELLIQLDTGSSDLWVNLPNDQIEITNITNITAQETYGIGAVTGPIAFANVSLGPHFVPDQAFINATNATDFGTIFGDNVRGILGLSFDLGSTVAVEIAINYNSSIGRSFISNLFAQNESMPHLFTVQLGRTSDPEYVTEGIFTIGEYVNELAAVAEQPQLPRFPNSDDVNTPPRWSTVMSGMTVNGQPFQFNASGVPGTPNGSVVAVLDTGFTFPPIPAAAVDFIYSSIEGATFDNSSGFWIVPCENSTQLEFQFGNQSIPIHPLDITEVTELNNATVCVNTFRPTTFPVNDQFDIILGDAFLKNVYASFNYGNWSAENPNAIPFIQLLSTTNLTAAFDEFAQVRSSMVSSAEATASVSATTVTTASATASSGAASGSVLPTSAASSVFFSSAWSSYPASSAATVSASVVSASASASAPSTTADTTNAANATDATVFSRRSLQVVVEPSRNVTDCLLPIIEQYGVVLFALLTGSLVVSLVLAMVMAVITIRNHMRLASRRRATYSVLEAKAETLADPEGSSLHYHDEF